MSNVINLDFHRLKRENDKLLKFIGESITDKCFLAVNVHLVKNCIMEWHDANKKLQEMEGNNALQSDVRSAQRVQKV